jgi:hypothetical protein
MRIYTKIILQMTDDPTVYLPVAAVSYSYDGPVVLCKGDSTAQASEQSQASFDNTLQQIFQQQYQSQTAQLNYLKNQLQPQITNPSGYSPAELAALRTSASDTNATQYQNAQTALNNQISQQSGGSKLVGVSGATTEADAGLLNAEAQQEANSQNQITQQNAQLKQANYWNSINALNGVAAQANPLGYANSSTSGSGAVAGLSQANSAANQSQLLGALGGVASGAGSALGGWFAKGCWIFASFFGWDDVRTRIMRKWLHTKAPVWFRDFYMTYGEQIAGTPFRWAFRPIASWVLQG